MTHYSRGDDSRPPCFELVLFRAVLASLDSSPEMDEFLHRALVTITHHLGPGSSGLVLVDDPQHPGLVVAAHVGVSAQALPVRVFWSDCLCRELFDSGLPLVIKDCRGCSCDVCRFHEERTHLAVPLKSRETVLGALCLVGPPDFEIAVDDLSFWEDLGILIGRVVDQSWLRSQIHRERELLQILYEVGDHLATSLDLDLVLSRVLDLSVAATGAQDGSIFLLPVSGLASATPVFCAGLCRLRKPTW